MNFFTQKVVSPLREMAAYETIWAIEKTTQDTVADLFRQNDILPSQLLENLKQRDIYLDELHQQIKAYLKKFDGFSVSIHGDFQYPKKLRDAASPIELFYYKGDIGLTECKSVSLVGARKCTPEGATRAKRLAKELVEAGFAIVSGLAKGIDTAAMTSAIEAGGNTIGVIGTPINECYPKENKELQDRIASDFLLISQFPFFRSSKDPFFAKKQYFPRRNITMAALSDATVIVEASESSGTLTQAVAAIKQGRPLFILNSCFENKAIEWPAKFEAKGAIRVRNTADIVNALESN